MEGENSSRIAIKSRYFRYRSSCPSPVRPSLRSKFKSIHPPPPHYFAPSRAEIFDGHSRVYSLYRAVNFQQCCRCTYCSTMMTGAGVRRTKQRLWRIKRAFGDVISLVSYVTRECTHNCVYLDLPWECSLYNRCRCATFDIRFSMRDLHRSPDM